MPIEASVMLFQLSGEAEFFEPRDDSARILTSENIVEQMNKQADLICEKIEKEIKKLLPPMTTVQAAVQFENGSLLLTGTVAVLTWGGSLALDSLKKELQEQIAPLVKMAVQRVMNRELAARNMLTSVRPMSMNVTPQPLPATLQQRVIVPAAEAVAASSVPGGLVANRPVTTGQFWGLAIATLFIFLIQIVLILDRFMTLQWRT